ncbi:MAG: hypothetical protein IPM84_21865 [Anaerolineae bacterium]|nr:hypothetical protein [Anaerolineae bacterium]
MLNDSRRVTEETRQRARRRDPTGLPRQHHRSQSAGQRDPPLCYTWQPSPPDQFNPILDSFLQAAVVPPPAAAIASWFFPRRLSPMNWPPIRR